MGGLGNLVKYEISRIKIIGRLLLTWSALAWVLVYFGTYKHAYSLFHSFFKPLLIWVK